jgi:hypothetical protein
LLASGALGFALAALATTLGGCAPMRVELIQPQAPGGKIMNRRCPPQPDYLVFERGGVRSPNLLVAWIRGIGALQEAGVAA